MDAPIAKRTRSIGSDKKKNATTKGKKRKLSSKKVSKAKTSRSKTSKRRLSILDVAKEWKEDSISEPMWETLKNSDDETRQRIIQDAKNMVHALEELDRDDEDANQLKRAIERIRACRWYSTAHKTENKLVKPFKKELDAFLDGMHVDNRQIETRRTEQDFELVLSLDADSRFVLCFQMTETDGDAPYRFAFSITDNNTQTHLFECRQSNESHRWDQHHGTLLQVRDAMGLEVIPLSVFVTTLLFVVQETGIQWDGDNFFEKDQPWPDFLKSTNSYWWRQFGAGKEENGLIQFIQAGIPSHFLEGDGHLIVDKEGRLKRDMWFIHKNKTSAWEPPQVVFLSPLIQDDNEDEAWFEYALRMALVHRVKPTMKEYVVKTYPDQKEQTQLLSLLDSVVCSCLEFPTSLNEFKQHQLTKTIRCEWGWDKLNVVLEGGYRKIHDEEQEDEIKSKTKTTWMISFRTDFEERTTILLDKSFDGLMVEEESTENPDGWFKVHGFTSKKQTLDFCVTLMRESLKQVKSITVHSFDEMMV